MDAASHTGVDEMRQLIEQVPYKPVQALFKVCLIDEVHMLSKSSFNALLKTLEEPPPHSIFLFATTEPQRIPMTVLSRCQRFDLHRLSSDMIAGHLRHIAELEGFVLDMDIAALIARHAEGSMRDALSLLDALFSGSEEKTISASLVHNMLGVSGPEDLLAFLDTIVSGDVQAVLTALETFYQRGLAAESLLRDMLDVSHALLMLKTCGAAAYFSACDEACRSKAQALTERLSKTSLLRLWQMLLQGFEDLRLAPHDFSALEVVVMRVMHGVHLPSLERLIAHFTDAGTSTKETTESVHKQQEESPTTDMAASVRKAFPDAKRCVSDDVEG